MGTAVATDAVFVPLPWQVAPFYDKSPIMLLTGSAGGGKSVLAAEKVVAFLLKYPGATGLVLRKSRQSLVNSALLTLEAAMGRNTKIVHVPSKFRFEFPNGSILAYGGMFDEQQRQAVRSIGVKGGVDIAWMEEGVEFEESDFNELLGRMRGRAAGWNQIIVTTNPGHPQHWIKRRLIDQGQAKVYSSRAQDNPHNPESYLVSLSLMSGVLGSRLRDGQWVQAEGVVYPMWDPAVHIVDPFPIPAHWMRIAGVDFGYRNPSTVQWWALSPEGILYLYRQVYRTKVSAPLLAEQCLQLSGQENVRYWITDHDPERMMVLQDAGLHNVVPAQKDVLLGIQAVEARLRGVDPEKVAQDWLAHQQEPDWVPPLNKPTLYVFRGSLVGGEDPDLVEAKLPTCLEDEIPNYTWERDAEGRALRERPRKLGDHGCFVAGTLVTTDRGRVPIQQIRPGDMVLTRQGYFPVLHVGCTGVKEVISHMGLVGTPDHPVITRDGNISLHALRYSDRLILDTDMEVTTWLRQKESSMEIVSTGVTRTGTSGRTGSTTRHQATRPPTCTGNCGRMPTARCRRGTAFTTGTATPTTIPFSTWSVSGAGITSSTMPRTCPRKGGSKAPTVCGSRKYNRRQPLGIARQRVRRGTARTAYRLGRSVSGWRRRARCVARPTPRRSPTALSTAIPTVKPEPFERVGVDYVYNLQIDGPSEYFANGILVHNCDCMRYICAFLDWTPKDKLVTTRSRPAFVGGR